MTNNVQKDMNASCKLHQSQLVFQNLLFDLFIGNIRLIYYSYMGDRTKAHSNTIVSSYV